MHRFSLDFIGAGLFLPIFIAVFGPLAYSTQGTPGLVWALVIFGTPSLICLWYRNITFFSDDARCITHRSGFYPWMKERQIHYDDVEKLTLSGFSDTSNSGSSSARYNLRLFVRGNAKSIRIAMYGEQEIRRDAPIIEAICASSKFALEKTDGYLKTRERYDGSRDRRNAQSKPMMIVGVFCLLVAGYFALAHAGTPLPFQSAIEPLFTPSPKGNWGEGVEVIALILGLGLGMVGIGNYFLTK